MSRVMPIYQGIEKLRKEGDHLQWGGPFLHKAGHFSSMPNGRALFSVLSPPDRRASAGKFYLATRRGKQFNSMTFGAADRLMGAKSRDIIFISPEVAHALELPVRARVVLRTDSRAMH